MVKSAQGVAEAVVEKVVLPVPEGHSVVERVPLMLGEREVDGQGELEREALVQKEGDAEAETDRLTVGERVRVGDTEEVGLNVGEALLLLLERVEREIEGEPESD